MSSSILLKDGVALLHQQNDRVKPTNNDILVEGNKITKIEEFLDVPAHETSRTVHQIPE